MINLLLPLAALTLLCATAQAASSIDLSVSGKITPSACEPSLSNGGVLELGKIPAKDLNLDQPTRLPDKRLQLTLTCQALTLVALKPSDNRAGSPFDSDNPLKFGLGLINGDEKVGSLLLRLESIIADDAAMQPIGSVGSSTWAPTPILSPTFRTSFTLDRTTPDIVPDAIQRLTADVLIEPTIAPANTLTLTQEVPIDGSITLDINYL
ncbi:DUF1120 domain-containing protein [Pseudomonas sp. Marseille-Q1929]|uniref:DUF1120 domain-containing protein n=1 Tax=Pseudomonas sp. Marseille-Q1929 TaxID=2730402 RepID=UPI003242EF52